MKQKSCDVRHIQQSLITLVSGCWIGLRWLVIEEVQETKEISAVMESLNPSNLSLLVPFSSVWDKTVTKILLTSHLHKDLSPPDFQTGLSSVNVHPQYLDLLLKNLQLNQHTLLPTRLDCARFCRFYSGSAIINCQHCKKSPYKQINQHSDLIRAYRCQAMQLHTPDPFSTEGEVSVAGRLLARSWYYRTSVTMLHSEVFNRHETIESRPAGSPRTQHCRRLLDNNYKCQVHCSLSFVF